MGKCSRRVVRGGADAVSTDKAAHCLQPISVDVQSLCGEVFLAGKGFCLAICTAGVCDRLCIMSSAIDVNCLKPTTFIAHSSGSASFVAEEGKKEFALPLHNRHMRKHDVMSTTKAANHLQPPLLIAPAPGSANFIAGKRKKKRPAAQYRRFTYSSITDFRLSSWKTPSSRRHFKMSGLVECSMIFSSSMTISYSRPLRYLLRTFTKYACTP